MELAAPLVDMNSRPFQSRKWVAWAMCWAACVAAYAVSVLACWHRPEAGSHIAMISGVFIPSMCGLCGYYVKKQGDIDVIKEGLHEQI